MSAPTRRFNRKMARQIRKLAQTPKGRQGIKESVEELERWWVVAEGMISRGEDVERAIENRDTIEHNLKIMRDALSEVQA